MNIDFKFGIWCVKKCLPLWDVPPAVFIWLDDPTDKMKAAMASDAAEEIEEKEISAKSIADAEDAIAILAKESRVTTARVWAAGSTRIWARVCASIDAPVGSTVGSTSEWVGSKWAANALRTSVSALKHEFVSTLTYEELKTTDPDWIEYVTAEIFER